MCFWGVLSAREGVSVSVWVCECERECVGEVSERVRECE